MSVLLEIQVSFEDEPHMKIYSRLTLIQPSEGRFALIFHMTTSTARLAHGSSQLKGLKYS